MEDYFAQPEELLLNDARPEYGYQVCTPSLLDIHPKLMHARVGVTLENTEKPRCSADADGRCKALIAQLEPSERPLDMLGALSFS